MKKGVKLFRMFILAQLVWTFLHVVVNSTGLINSWELGGYAMYTTVPSDVVYTPVLIRHEGKNEPHLPGAEKMRWWLDGGGCLFALTKRRMSEVAADMDSHDIDELMILFENYDFSPDRGRLQFVEMARFHATRDEAGSLNIELTACGFRRSLVLPEGERA